MHGQKNFTIFVLEILLKYQVTNWWLKNLLMWANEEADFSPEINKSFIFHGMGLLLIFTFGVRTLDRSSEPVQCALAWLGEWKYDYINLHLNDNSSQIHLSIVFKLSDHKANICSYSLIAKILELLDILYFWYFFRKSNIPQYQSFWYNFLYTGWSGTFQVLKMIFLKCGPKVLHVQTLWMHKHHLAVSSLTTAG